LALAAILWYVQKLLKNLRLASSEAWTPVLRPVSEMALGSPAYRSQIGASGERQSNQFEQLASVMATQGEPAKAGSSQAADRRMPKIDIPAISPEFEKLQRAVSDAVDSDPSSIAEAIQLWLNEDEHRNG
jgi:hypothetical protein